MKALAYAKINYFLDIESKRKNGYHNIKSLMQTVNIYDEITVNLRDDNEIHALCANITDLSPENENITYKIAKKFYEYTKINGGCDIIIQKNIPVAAGLAGGSSDGACVLKMLNILYNCRLNDQELIKIATSVGADIPFCLIGGTAIVKGIGEELTKIDTDKHKHIVVACGNTDKIKTPFAYKKLDEMYNDFKGYISKYNFEEFINCFISNTDYPKKMFNIFGSVSNNTSIAEIKKEMITNGAIISQMSGSGPSVFGIFKTKDDADMVVDNLNNKGIFAKYCQPVEY